MICIHKEAKSIRSLPNSPMIHLKQIFRKNQHLFHAYQQMSYLIEWWINIFQVNVQYLPSPVYK